MKKTNQWSSAHYHKNKDAILATRQLMRHEEMSKRIIQSTPISLDFRNMIKIYIKTGLDADKIYFTIDGYIVVYFNSKKILKSILLDTDIVEDDKITRVREMAALLFGVWGDKIEEMSCLQKM